MGDSWLKSSEEEQLTSYTKTFEELCPFYMAIGMTYDEFWYEDCWIAYYQLKAYKIKKEQENEKLWLQGMYIYEAIIDVSPILHAFSKKGTKPLPYAKEPYSLGTKKETEKVDEKERKKELLKAQLFFENWVTQTQKKFKDKK